MRDTMFKDVKSEIGFGGKASNGIHVQGTVVGADKVYVVEQFGEKVSSKARIEYVWSGHVHLTESGFACNNGVSVHRRGGKPWGNDANWEDEKKIHAAIKEVVEKHRAENPLDFQIGARVAKMNDMITAYNKMAYIDEEIADLYEEIKRKREKRDELHPKVNALAMEVQESGKELKNTLLAAIGRV